MRLKSACFMFCYRLAATALILPAACYLALRRRRDPPYGWRFWQLFGLALPRLRGGCVVFHAASMGEANSLKALAGTFALAHPGTRTVVSVMTTTGREAALRIKGVDVVFAPLDQFCACRRFFRRLRPRMLVTVDTELWPEKLAAARRFGCPFVIVNGRMQQKNLEKYLRHPALAKDLLGERLACVLCASEEDAARYRALGVPSERVAVTGNLKYDIEMDPQKLAKGRGFRQDLGCPVLGALSLHSGEEVPVIGAFLRMREQIPDLRLVLVPRHKEDGEAACALMDSKGLAYERRSALRCAEDFTSPVLLGDTMGEMALYIGMCHAAFMGGSFCPIGGHNPIEPASCGVPVLTGPDFHNFKGEYAALMDSGGAVECQSEDDLAQKACALLSSDEELERRSKAALEAVQSGRGAVGRTLETLGRILDHGVEAQPPAR
ncbi:MAG: 3-deoxy-D-manno-octulosonic acid transferase [Aeromonadales bacterium]|nr:3-deoxy-D-manno-octulosonic acid transferase [Aeromonadales bacterium]MDY2891386.1 3-deoxy-D-manno-octulosonic acid transferase [Succinivibrio sp.]